MTSILNNAGAQVALSTLTDINNKLLDTQSSISTGKTVANSADNAAIWAVTTIMEADVSGFNAIADSLSLGKATVTVARNASEQITDLLEEVKTKVVTANGENVDRDKIQTDIDELKNQISSIVSAAQFNGLNLIDGSTDGEIEVLASLDRSSTGVDATSIKVSAQNLSTGSASAGQGAAITAGVEVEDSETNAATTVNTLSVSWANGTTTSDVEYELYVDGSSVGQTVLISSGATDEEIAQQVQAYIEDLGRDDIKATITGSGVDIESTKMFDSVDVNLQELRNDATVTSTGTAGTSGATTLIPGVSSLQTTNGDANTTAATITVGGTVAAADTLDISIGGEALGTFSGMVATDAAASGDALATFINSNLTTNLTGKITATSDGAGTVTLSMTGEKNLDIELSVAAAGAGTTTVALDVGDSAATGLAGAPTTLTLDDVGTSVTGTMEAKAANLELGSAAVSEGDSYTVYLREGLDGPVGEFTYVAGAGEDQNDVAQGLADLISADSDYDVSVNVITDDTTSANARLQIDSTGSEDVYVALEAAQGGSGSGGLGKLAGIDVGTAASSAQALEDIEDLIQTAVDAASAFGSSETRLEIQEEFVTSLVDSMENGISALVDTDMEHASAKLQALQVQQQLATQALSITSSSAQNILSLFQ